jgi:ribosomal protein L16 Arg81 hydroxylase
MSLQENDILSRFGIDEIYFYNGFSANLLEKLHQRAVLSLDASDAIVLNHVFHDMILIFHKKVPSQNLLYRFLKFLHLYADKENFIKSNTLLNADELFSAIKSKNYALITHRTLTHEICHVSNE